MVRLSFGIFLFLLSGIVYAADDARSVIDYKSVYDCDGSDKFKWYCEGQEESKKPKPEPVPEVIQVVPPENAKPAELAEFKKIQERLKELLQIAYVNPTKENIYNYIEYQNFVTEKAAVFTDNWKRVQWVNPELDYQQKHSTASKAKKVARFERSIREEVNLEHLKEQGYGLFFFYRSDGPYCHEMEWPLKQLKARSGLDTISISLDGRLVEKFPNNRTDNGQAEKLGVTQTPTIMLVNPQKELIQPIATGWVSLQELENRIYVLTATKPGDNY